MKLLMTLFLLVSKLSERSDFKSQVTFVSQDSRHKSR